MYVYIQLTQISVACVARKQPVMQSSSTWCTLDARAACEVPVEEWYETWVPVVGS